jgi:hypothetical protein
MTINEFERYNIISLEEKWREWGEKSFISWEAFVWAEYNKQVRSEND